MTVEISEMVGGPLDGQLATVVNGTVLRLECAPPEIRERHIYRWDAEREVYAYQGVVAHG